MSAVAGSTGEVHTEVAAPMIQGRSPRQLFWMRFRQDKAALFGASVIIVLVLLAVFAGVISNIVGHGPNEVFQAEMSDDFGIPKGPNSSFWFGADSASRDLFVRVIYGARTSLLVALFATSIAMVFGVTVGVLAGYYRGFADALLSRISDVVLAMPVLLRRDRHRRGLRSDGRGVPRRARRARPRPRRLRDLGLHLALCRAHRPLDDALVAREGVRRGRALAGRERPAHHRARDPAQPGRADHDLRDAADPRQHPLRGGALVSSASASRPTRRRGGRPSRRRPRAASTV